MRDDSIDTTGVDIWPAHLQHRSDRRRLITFEIVSAWFPQHRALRTENDKRAIRPVDPKPATTRRTAETDSGGATAAGLLVASDLPILRNPLRSAFMIRAGLSILMMVELLASPIFARVESGCARSAIGFSSGRSR